MNKKYKLKSKGNIHRIIALRDVPRYGVEAGDKGGLVSGEHNLRHKGDCWIGHDARVYDDALVCDNACVRDNYYTQTKVCGTAIIGGTTCIDSGTWETTPKVIKGSAYDVIYNARQIAIGCECHPLEWWEEHGLWVAEEDNFTPVMVEEYRGYLNAIKKEYANDKEV